MAEDRSSWRERGSGADGSAAGSGPFDRAAVAPLFEALNDPLEEVRTGALRALVRLPLANQVWLELGEFIGPILAGPPEESGAGIPRRELIRAAVYIPMREMRGLLQRLVDEGPADERLEAARALALARDPYGASALLTELRSDDPYRQRTGAEALAMLPAGPVKGLRECYRQPLDGDARFWLVVALARSGDVQAVRAYVLDLDAGRVERPFLVVTSGQPLQYSVPGGPLPEGVGKAAQDLAGDENLSELAHEIAQGLADASAAPVARWTRSGAAAKPHEAAPSPEELERLREAGRELAARYLEEPPLAGDQLPPPEEWQLLGHVPPDVATRLVTAFFGQISQQVGEGDQMRTTLSGNHVMLLPDSFWAGFVPDIPALLPSYATLKEHFAFGPAEQLAWVVSRAGLGDILAGLAPRLPAADAAERAAIVSLLERGICYARWNHRPFFGGGSGAGDVLPAEEAFLERESQLESARPGIGDDEALALHLPAEPDEAGASKGLIEDAKPAPRKIQGHVYEVGAPGPDGLLPRTEERRAFRAGGDFQFDVFIGPEEADAIVAPVALPDHLLPQDRDSYGLTLIYSELLPVPKWQVGNIILPKGSGRSTAWTFSFSVAPSLQVYEGRLQVIFENRTLQTVILTGPVVADPAVAPDGTKIEFCLDTPVRASVAGLEQASERVATLLVDTPKGSSTPVLLASTVANGQHRIALQSLDGIDNALKSIRGRLEKISLKPDDYKGLDSPLTVDLLCVLAQQGRALYNALQVYLEGFPLESDRPIQLVSARESFLPLEFIYDRPAPLDDAKIYPNAVAALAAGKCTFCEGLDNEEAEKYICPLGFWALRRVIERHAVRPVAEAELGGADFAVESDPGGSRTVLNVLNAAVFAASNRVRPEDVEILRSSLDTATVGKLAQVQDWASWREAVKVNRPSLLVLVAHTLRNKSEIPTLEIGELQRLVSVNIDSRYVRPQDAPMPPVVLLLGCDTAVLDIQFENFATQFRVNGAAIVLNTLAPVLGRHVAPVGRMLVEEMRRTAAEGGTFGAALLAVRRRGLAEGLPVVLALVAYGDADWGIRA